MPPSDSAGGAEVADLTAANFRIDRPSDVLGLIGQGVERVLLADAQLNPDFFDLSTGFAGELLQKCANYGIRVAVILTADEPHSTSFRQFVGESNRGNQFLFVTSSGEGKARLLIDA